MVKVISTRGSSVRPAKASRAAATAAPQATPPTIVSARNWTVPRGVIVAPVAKAMAMPNATAAVLSLRRLSASTSSRSRPCTPASLKVAITDTGSVAEISTPNSSAACQLQWAR